MLAAVLTALAPAPVPMALVVPATPRLTVSAVTTPIVLSRILAAAASRLTMLVPPIAAVIPTAPTRRLPPVLAIVMTPLAVALLPETVVSAAALSEIFTLLLAALLKAMFVALVRMAAAEPIPFWALSVRSLPGDKAKVPALSTIAPPVVRFRLKLFVVPAEELPTTVRLPADAEPTVTVPLAVMASSSAADTPRVPTLSAAPAPTCIS